MGFDEGVGWDIMVEVYGKGEIVFFSRTYLYFNNYRQIIVNFVGFNVAACSALGLERGGIRNVKC